MRPSLSSPLPPDLWFEWLPLPLTLAMSFFPHQAVECGPLDLQTGTSKTMSLNKPFFFSLKVTSLSDFVMASQG